MSALYIHFPFCTKKCSYCNFYSSTALTNKNDFIEALKIEIEKSLNYLPTRNLQTIYFGGGTPSLFTIEELASIFNIIEKYYSFHNELEFTIEANPEQLTFNYLKQLKNLGINRLSIGIQSFNDDVLTFLQRHHNAETAKMAIENAINAQFDNISIDLMYGISVRHFEQWQHDLETAFSYPINHLSAYALTVEENTLLHTKIKKGIITATDDEQTVDEFFLLLGMSRKNGFEQYEISNFAKPNFISKHNFSYWRDVPYLGLGPSAHSYNRTSRKWNVANLTKYIEKIRKNESYFETEILTKKDRYNEFVLLHLRTCEGVNPHAILDIFGNDYYQNFILQLQSIDNKYYTIKNSKIILTDIGKLWSDKIALTFFLI